MRPIFMRINNAVNFTREYYGIGKIKDYLEWYAQKIKNPNWTSYLDTWSEFIFTLHGYMEDEILQTVHTSNNNTQVYLFEGLRSLINDDWQFAEKINSDHLYAVLLNYNEKKNEEFEETVRQMIIKHQESYNYKNLKDGETYIEKSPPFLGGMGLIFNSINRESKEKTFRKILCVDKSPEYVDIFHLPKYIELVQSLITNFRKIVIRHLNLFDAGKYVSATEIVKEKEVLKIEQPEQKLIEPIAESTRKLELNLSVPQLVVLFCLLREMNIINEPVNTELARFIKANFSTKSSVDISEKTLVNQFSSLDGKAINYWLDQLKQMRIGLTNLKG